MTPFADRLTRTVREKNSRVVVGLDPRLDRLPEPFRRVVATAIAKNPADRYPNVAAMVSALGVPDGAEPAADRMVIETTNEPNASTVDVCMMNCLSLFAQQPVKYVGHVSNVPCLTWKISTMESCSTDPSPGC